MTLGVWWVVPTGQPDLRTPQHPSRNESWVSTRWVFILHSGTTHLLPSDTDVRRRGRSVYGTQIRPSSSVSVCRRWSSRHVECTQEGGNTVVTGKGSENGGHRRVTDHFRISDILTKAPFGLIPKDRSPCFGPYTIHE